MPADPEISKYMLFAWMVSNILTASSKTPLFLFHFMLDLRTLLDNFKETVRAWEGSSLYDLDISQFLSRALVLSTRFRNMKSIFAPPWHSINASSSEDSGHCSRRIAGNKVLFPRNYIINPLLSDVTSRGEKWSQICLVEKSRGWRGRNNILCPSKCER